MTDEEACELLDFIGGRGRWTWLGSSGYATYPDGDENAQRLHAACEDLQAHGFLGRENRDGYVLWKLLDT